MLFFLLPSSHLSPSESAAPETEKQGTISVPAIRRLRLLSSILFCLLGFLGFDYTTIETQKYIDVYPYSTAYPRHPLAQRPHILGGLMPKIPQTMGFWKPKSSFWRYFGCCGLVVQVTCFGEILGKVGSLRYCYDCFKEELDSDKAPMLVWETSETSGSALLRRMII